MARKVYTDTNSYERKLSRVMDRFGIGPDDFNFNYDRHSAWVQFRYKGELYMFEHSAMKAQERGLKIQYGSDCFCQIVLCLEDLARAVERGIYDLQAWVKGMQYLPPAIEVPSFFKFLGFAEIPAGPEEVRERYRTLSKQMHPDAGGNEEDFQKLKAAAEQGVAYFEKTGGE